MHHVTALLCASLLAVAGTRAVGQCPLQWQPGDPIPFVNGNARASLVFDPDGAGPSAAVLVVGGRFRVGTMLDTCLATYDGNSWSTLGTPPLVEVTAMVNWNGLLVAAGAIGIQHAVVSWNGTAWSVLGIVSGRVNTLAVFQSDLFVGGFFASVGPTTAHNIARWNGSAWSDPGQGVTGEVFAMAVFGSLQVGGALTQAGALPVSNLASWNGTTWAAGANTDAPVRSLAARNGTTPATTFLFAGGDFTTIAGVPAQRIARFTSSTGAWTAIPGLPGTTCRVIHVRSTSSTTFQLHAAIESATVLDKVWRLVGTTWTTLGATFDTTELLPRSLAFFNGQYYVAFAANHIASATIEQAVRVHDGTSWLPVSGPGFDDRIDAVTTLGNELVVGGRFRRYGSVTLERIARGSPGAWQPLGTGIAGTGGGTGVRALCTLPNGDIVAGGLFTTAGGAAASNIARWNGSTWQSLGSGVNGNVEALLPLPNGDLIAGGTFTQAGGLPIAYIARWNGTTWSPLGGGVDADVLALARLHNGDIVATGFIVNAGGAPATRIARWNGTAWSPLGSGLDDAGLALAVLPDGDLVAAGFFLVAGGIVSPSVARWNGTTWLEQSTTLLSWDAEIKTLVALPNGEYVAGGQPSFFGLGGGLGGSDANVARHRGGATSLNWDALDLVGPYVAAAALLPNGDLVFGGDFHGAGGLASHNLAVLRPSCPASAVAHGSDCAGAGGTNVLTATALPWLGSTFRARATGMPTNGLALGVTGLAPAAIPMPAVLAQGVAGCTLLAAPDLIDVVLPAAGAVATQLALPGSVALAGAVFYHQVVPLEIDLAGNLVAVTGTNGLTMTIGML